MVCSFGARNLNYWVLGPVGKDRWKLGRCDANGGLAWSLGSLTAVPGHAFHNIVLARPFLKTMHFLINA